MRLLIFGSRDINVDHVADYLERMIVALKPSHLVTAGEPEGTCAIARHLAQQHAIPLVLHFKHKARKAGQYHHRSVAALKDCDQAIFCYNGTSRGTANEIELARKLAVPHTVERFTAGTDYGWQVDDPEL